LPDKRRNGEKLAAGTAPRVWHPTGNIAVIADLGEETMNRDSLRSRPYPLLIAASLVMSLVLGATFITMHRIYDLRGPAVEAPVPLTDEQIQQQVLEPARQIVGAASLEAVTGTYLPMSCAPEDAPPYQGTAYLNFDLPTITQTPAFFRAMTRALTARGWTAGLPPSHHPGGRTMAKDGVTAVYYRDPDTAGRGVLRLYGECRSMTDHRRNSGGFVDITGLLSR
jgi:hypothetical protein